MLRELPRSAPHLRGFNALIFVRIDLRIALLHIQSLAPVGSAFYALLSYQLMLTTELLRTRFVPSCLTLVSLALVLHAYLVQIPANSELHRSGTRPRTSEVKLMV